MEFVPCPSCSVTAVLVKVMSDFCATCSQLEPWCPAPHTFVVSPSLSHPRLCACSPDRSPAPRLGVQLLAVHLPVSSVRLKLNAEHLHLAPNMPRHWLSISVLGVATLLAAQAPNPAPSLISLFLSRSVSIPSRNPQNMPRTCPLPTPPLQPPSGPPSSLTLVVTNSLVSPPSSSRFSAQQPEGIFQREPAHVLPLPRAP